MDLTLEIDKFLNRINNPPQKKVAKKFSNVTGDESGSRTLHVVVPKVDKEKNEITPY